MKILYFAWVRQKIGRGEETVERTAGLRTVGDLAAQLHARGGGYADAFGDMSRLRAAVNQAHAAFDAAIADDDEIAFFPPVTGG